MFYLSGSSTSLDDGTMFPCALITIVSLLAVTVYWYLTKTFNYWKSQNVPSAANTVPGFGHVLPLIILKESLNGFAERLYQQTHASVLGFYFLRTPGIIVRDPELVKSVLQTNFSNFRANFASLDEANDPIISKNPFFESEPHAWKASRLRTISHISGGKLRTLHQYVSKVASKMHDFVNRKIKENSGVYECQLKLFCERYNGEFVANSAFGVEGEGFEDNPSSNAFTKITKVLFEPSLVNGVKQAVMFYLPAVAKHLKISFLTKSTENYLRDTLKFIINERKRKGCIVVDDYLQFCLEDTPEDEFNKVIADIIMFHVDSYETSSLTLSILLYHLSKYTDVQAKLREHVRSVVSKHDGEVTYESLKDMTYLDQVTLESMRMIPAAGVLQKKCTEEITLKGSDGLTFHLKPGQLVIVPSSELQMDARYWREPEVFNPDRFSPENQSNNTKFAFMPFGEGPRICAGMRLAQMLVKYATASLILKFSLEKSSITKEPLERDPNAMLSYYKGGLWAKFKKIA